MFEHKITFDFQTTQEIFKKIGFIESFKGKWDILENDENIELKELKHIATIESIGSSTRIEGSVLTDSEIKDLLQNIHINKIDSRSKQEVVGYFDSLNIIFDNFKNIDLSESYIKQLHNILLKYSSKDDRHKGEYKNITNKVIAKYPGGIQKVIFNTTEPFLVKKEMAELISWTNENIKKNKIHELLLIPLFIYEFLSIHPFQDGNGRLSRLFTTLLLLRYDYTFVKYISFEHIIEKRKKEYYQALMECQKNRYKENEKIDKWIIFFLECLEELIKKLEIKYKEFSNRTPYLNQRQKEIFTFISKSKSVKVKDLNEAFPNISRNTIKKDLTYLVNNSIIRKTGIKKGTIYSIINNPDDDIRTEAKKRYEDPNSKYIDFDDFKKKYD
jgi:Fic family protein